MLARILLISSDSKPAPDEINNPIACHFAADKHLVQSLNNQGLKVGNVRLDQAADFDLYSINHLLGKYDLVLNRFISNNQLNPIDEFDALTERLRDFNIPVVNSFSASRQATDALAVYQLFKENNIPTPKTVLAEKFNDYLDDRDFQEGLIYKPRFGSRIWEILTTSKRRIPLEPGYVVQAEINADVAYQAICCNNQVLGVYEKDFNQDIFTGFSSSSLDKNDPDYTRVSKMALKMHQASGLFISGSDLMIDYNDDLHALDLSAVPELHQQKITDQIVSQLLKNF